MKQLSILVISCIFFLATGSSFVATGQESSTAGEPLKSPDPKVRAQAARDLGRSGDSSAIPVLKAALIDPDVKVRREVVMALASIHKLDSLAPLAAASRDSENDIQVLAIQCLVGYYTGQTPEAGFTGFMKKNVARAKDILVSDDTRIDPGIEVDPVVLAALENGLADTRSTQVQRDSIRGLGILMARQAVPDLVKAAHDTDADLARQALNSLGKIKDTSAGPQLLDLLDSPSKDVRRDAAVTVGILQTHDAVAKLQSIFEANSDRKTNEKALEGLAYLGDPVSIPLFVRELWSANKTFRISAAEGLGRAGDKNSIPELEKAMASEKDAETKLAIQFALTDLGKDDYAKTIIQELDSKLHGDKAQTYLEELARKPAFLPKLYPALSDQDATIRRKIAVVLVYTGDSTSIPPLETLSHDSNSDVAAAALRALRATRARTVGKT